MSAEWGALAFDVGMRSLLLAPILLILVATAAFVRQVNLGSEPGMLEPFSEYWKRYVTLGRFFRLWLVLLTGSIAIIAIASYPICRYQTNQLQRALAYCTAIRIEPCIQRPGTTGETTAFIKTSPQEVAAFSSLFSFIPSPHGFAGPCFCTTDYNIEFRRGDALLLTGTLTGGCRDFHSSSLLLRRARLSPQSMTNLYEQLEARWPHTHSTDAREFIKKLREDAAVQHSR